MEQLEPRWEVETVTTMMSESNDHNIDSDTDNDIKNDNHNQGDPHSGGCG